VLGNDDEKVEIQGLKSPDVKHDIVELRNENRSLRELIDTLQETDLHGHIPL